MEAKRKNKQWLCKNCGNPLSGKKGSKTVSFRAGKQNTKLEYLVMRATCRKCRTKQQITGELYENIELIHNAAEEQKKELLRILKIIDTIEKKP